MALNYQSFSKFICRWLGAVHDCYLLSAAIYSNGFQTFRFLKNCPPQVIFESEEELVVLPATSYVDTPKISRQRKTLIWLISPTWLATVKVKMLKKTTMLFRVLCNRWPGIIELVLFFKTLWDDDRRAIGNKSKAVPYSDLKQMCAIFRLRHVPAMIFLHNGYVARARRI